MFFSAKLHGYMFGPLSGHFQAIEICKDNMATAECVLVSWDFGLNLWMLQYNLHVSLKR